jgi:putative transposase
MGGMARCRKRHVQVELEFHRRGGRRKRAGRKPAPGRRRVSHARRPEIDRRTPAHITLRVLDEVGRLRRRDAFKVVRGVMRERMGREDLRIIELSIQGNHIHLVCEAESRAALASGMQGFKIAVAKRLNRIRGRDGTVFSDRYHEEVLRTPTQTRRCLAYVLNNWRKHREDYGAGRVCDPYSTGMWFRGWKEARRIEVPAGLELLPRREPRSWLLAQGWKRGGPLISLYEVPGGR